VVEDLIHRVHARTLFATHYHTLAEESGALPGVQVASAAVAEEDGDVTFLHRITPGAMGKSYGIHVARLAGLPPHVLERAREILLNHEGAKDAKRVQRKKDERSSRPEVGMVIQHPSLSTQSALLADLARFDLARMTPLEAIAVLDRLQSRAREVMHYDEREISDEYMRARSHE
jgi:DNA mismatch repair protein MutS